MIAINSQLPAVTTSAPPASIEQTVERLLCSWLETLAASSRQTYLAALQDFATFAKADDVPEAIGRLLASGKQAATLLLTHYQATLFEVRGLSPATANIRVGALRSFVGYAYSLDVVAWTVKIRNLKSQGYRDTAGPGVENLRRMLDQVETRGDAKGARDVAILRLLYDVGLRRGEVIGLDVEHVDLGAGRLWIKGKGRTERESITLPQQTRDALAAWLAHRGEEPGPLFVSLSNRGRDGRISGQSVFQIVQRLGKAVSIRTSPHRLRHTAITTAAGEEGLMGAQRFARHSDPKITMVYVDRLEDVAGKVARKVAAMV